MVTFTKDSIIVKIKTKDPIENWLTLIQTCERVTQFLLTNEDKHPNDYDLYLFGELKEALLKLDLSYKQVKEIEKILLVA